MIRELISKFNRSLSESMVSSRRKHTAPIKVWFDPDANTERAGDLARAGCILGETVDISRSGIGFIVPSIRFKEKYLVGQQRTLNVEIDLPTGQIFLRAMGCRYEKVGIHISTERFFVGASIVSLTGTDRENYETFLKTGTRGLKRTSAQALELGID